jgi:hypothetical protein
VALEEDQEEVMARDVLCYVFMTLLILNLIAIVRFF